MERAATQAAEECATAVTGGKCSDDLIFLQLIIFFFSCRPGHIARECPEGEGGNSGRGGGAVCYRCDR